MVATAETGSDGQFSAVEELLEAWEGLIGSIELDPAIGDLTYGEALKHSTVPDIAAVVAELLEE